jgi:hypothetical protein
MYWELIMEQKNCVKCGDAFVVKRNPQQEYCGKPACQNARKNRWRQLKLKKDHDYRVNQKKADQHWHQRNTSYWRQYRAAHPNYVEKNRVLQRQRDQKRGKNASQICLAKSDASMAKNDDFSGIYQLLPLEPQR